MSLTHFQFAVESQIRHHNLSPETSLITIEAPSLPQPPLSTSHVLSVIKEHGSTTALLLLPGIQFYTGQFLDIPTITAAAQAAGIFVIWDLAHAVGNVPLELHDWNVDAAAWCSYKYLNAGPGAIGGVFVHEKHHTNPNLNRFAGWWGNDPDPGAQRSGAWRTTPVQTHRAVLAEEPAASGRLGCKCYIFRFSPKPSKQSAFKQ